MTIGSASQPTEFSLDVLGRYVCNSFDEAMASSDAAYRAISRDVQGNPLAPRGDLRPFDFIIIGGGTFGAAVAEHLWFRSTGRSERILVLEAGPFLLAEHMQNLPSLGLGREVWGLPWNSDPALGYGGSGLAYCVGGRSLWWGGWSPRLLGSETPAGVWPQAVLDDLNVEKLPDGDNGYFRQSGQQIGVTETNDYIFGELHNALREKLFAAITSGKVSDAMDLATLPDGPTVEILDAPPSLTDLARLLGVTLPDPLPTGTAAKALEAELRNKLKLEAPLAVQARPEHAGFFPLNKFSAVPLVMKAARVAYSDSSGDDVRKRLMVVPRCHVSRIHAVNDVGGQRVDQVITERGPITVPPDTKVIIALGTIESTRLALISFGEDGRIGTNLMAHLRSNLTFRMPREALKTLDPSVKALQASALLLKGQHAFQKADGSPDGTGHFHFQIVASGLGSVGSNAEAELFQKIPDVDTVNQHLNASDSHVVITIRGIGEMQPGNNLSNVTPDRNPNQVDFGERKAWVNLQPSAKDFQLWDVMDKASDELAVQLASGYTVDVLHPVTGAELKKGVDAATLATEIPHKTRDQDPNGRRDPLGSTHHEAGTLRMGDDPTKSVTDADCRFHGISNVYVAGPALFPTIGSPNPMLTGIALARRLGDHLLPPAPVRAAEPGFRTLFDGTQNPAQFFSTWLMAGGGSFTIVNRSLVAQPGNAIGLLYYAAEQFDNFTLRLDFCLPHPRGNINDNSGVFVRFRDPRKPVKPGTPGPDIPGNAATVAVDTGYEIQIDEEARGDTRKNEPDGFVYNRTGAIYKVKALGTAQGEQNYTNNQRLAAGVWHSFDITVTGRTYEVLLDGRPATKFVADPGDPGEKFRGRTKTEDPDSGFIGLQVHAGNIAFSNIRIK